MSNPLRKRKAPLLKIFYRQFCGQSSRSSRLFFYLHADQVSFSRSWVVLSLPMVL